jgi:biotin operon repressor
MQIIKPKCRNCEKTSLSKDEIGINKKMFGAKIKEFFCMSCLAEYLDVSEEDLLARIEEYKNQGCTAF